jgi:hypothetical protein
MPSPEFVRPRFVGRMLVACDEDAGMLCDEVRGFQVSSLLPQTSGYVEPKRL